MANEREKKNVGRGGIAEVVLKAARKGLRERISRNRIYCSLKERCKKRMGMAGGVRRGGIYSLCLAEREGVNCREQDYKWKLHIQVSEQRKRGQKGEKAEKTENEGQESSCSGQRLASRGFPFLGGIKCYSGHFLPPPLLRFNFLIK